MNCRTATVFRETSETAIRLDLNLDGSSDVHVNTGFGLADHLITLTAFWAGFDLTLTCQGDLHIDAHHTVEDCGLALGEAFFEASGTRVGIARVGSARVPMDEALADITLDISGRPWLEWRGADLLPPLLSGQERDLWREFWKAFVSNARINLHVSFLYGQNGHHLLESAFKGIGLALRTGVHLNRDGVFSTKGRLD